MTHTHTEAGKKYPPIALNSHGVGQCVLSRACVVAVLLLVLMSRWSLAQADELSPEATKEKAQIAFAEGEALFEAGAYDAAAEAFKRAYDILPHYAVLANIGVAYERAGEFPASVTYLQRYLAELTAAGGENPKLVTLLEETMGKVAVLRVATEGFAPDCTVVVDQIDRGSAPVEMVVSPGGHTIALQTGDTVLATEELFLSAGETRHLKLTEVEVAEPVKKPDPAVVTVAPVNEMRDEAPWSMPLKISVGVFAGAGIASGVLWGLAFKTKSDFDDETIRKEMEHLKTKGERQNAEAVIASVVAGAALVSATILYALQNHKTATKAAKDAQVRISPAGAGLAVEF